MSENVAGNFVYWPGVVAWGWGLITVLPRSGHPVEFVLVDNRPEIFSAQQSPHAGSYLVNRVGAFEAVSAAGVHVFLLNASSVPNPARVIQLPGP